MLASQTHSARFETTTDAAAGGAAHGDALAQSGELDSTRLLHGQREVLIRHGSEVYRLRHTRNDKLILTK